MTSYGRMQRNTNLLSCTKLNFKWIKDITIQPFRYIKSDGNEVENIFEFFSTEIHIVYRIPIPITQELKTTTKKWELMKLRSFCMAKDSHSDKMEGYRRDFFFFYRLHI